jgi:allantoin racemase
MTEADGSDPVRILVLAPFPLNDEQLALRAAQLEAAPLPERVVVDFKPTKAAPANYVSHHDYVLADISMLESGLSAEADGYDAVCIDTVSDSAVSALRSMLDIPVIGPGRTQYAVASMLGRQFGIVTMWRQWFPIYSRVLKEIGLADRCAGIRSIEASEALIEDGADVVCLGSTTMHEAHRYLQEHLPVPVINPGPLSYFIAEALVALGLSHSRRSFPRSLAPKPDMISAMLDAANSAETAAAHPAETSS